ncbi:hypothetical protein QBC32DRAFT_355971, partial [Pseudoneurospora amorphoporcata]
MPLLVNIHWLPRALLTATEDHRQLPGSRRPDDQHCITHAPTSSVVVCFHPRLSPNMSGLEVLSVASSIISIVD